MTEQKRRFINLEDIRAIEYRCKCGATVTIPRSEWKDRAPSTCPNCGPAPSRPTRWLSEGDEKSVIALQNSIKDVLSLKNLECEIRLEIEDEDESEAR